MALCFLRCDIDTMAATKCMNAIIVMIYNSWGHFGQTQELVPGNGKTVHMTPAKYMKHRWLISVKELLIVVLVALIIFML